MAKRLAVTAVCVGALLAVWWTPPASAHATLERAVPGEPARLARPPTVLLLFFDQPVAIQFSRVTVTADGGADLVSGQMREIRGEVLVPLRPGPDASYTVRWRMLSAGDGHVVQGAFSYGGPDNRFGAQRDGHTHQGQDLLAAEGTTVVAVRSGTIEYVGYQDGGAGWYVVLDGDNEDYDYAYMHLQEGSITVVKGQHVMAGQRLAAVGHTGDATVSHLHFEVWQGPWFAGGQAIDPLPFLQTWQAWSGAQTLK